ncbi:3469_t:CDS:2 [Rhizophagus irregularis]|nr:3469_t:CDS:2 [Rhizophagus irregularis]
MCESRADEMNTIICEVKKFFEETCNSLLVEAKKDPIIDIELINKMTFWDRTYSKTKITFMDLIKGIISCESAAWNFWINRCLKQKEKERRLKVNLKKVKENLDKDK